MEEKKITAERIHQALEAKEYELREECDCGCTIDWIINNNLELEADISSDCCYTSQILSIDGIDIAECVSGESTELFSGIPTDVEMEEIRDITSYENWDNEKHNNRMEHELHSFIENKLEEGARLFRDDKRGFANEFCSILILPGSEDEIDEDWNEQTIEEWISDFFYSGDASTQAYNSNRVI